MISKNNQTPETIVPRSARRYTMRICQLPLFLICPHTLYHLSSHNLLPAKKAMLFNVRVILCSHKKGKLFQFVDIFFTSINPWEVIYSLVVTISNDYGKAVTLRHVEFSISILVSFAVA